MRRTLTTTTRLVAFTAVVAATSAGCGASKSGSDSAAELDPFFLQFSYAHASEVALYDTLEDAERASTVVIRASIIGVETTRTLGDPLAGGVAYFGVRLRPTDVLSGALAPEHQKELTVEFVRRGAPTDYSHQDEDAIWFLHRKGEGQKVVPLSDGGPGDESSWYRLSSSQGLFIDTPEGVVNPIVNDDDTREAPERNGQLVEVPHVERADARTEGESYASLTDLAAAIRKK